MTTSTIHFIFEPFDDPHLTQPQPVESDWSRTAWLPVIGPSSWLMWTELVRLVANGPATITAADLADRIGLSVKRIYSPIDRLGRFRIVTELNSDHYRVLTGAGPLSESQLRRRPGRVAGIQADTFGYPRPRNHLRSV
jgi:hypothetical protein